MKILITGSTSGLGFELGCSLLEKGYFVYFTTHYQNQVKVVEEKLIELGFSSNYECFCLDITKVSDRKKALSLDIDCLVCNAAFGLGGSILDLSMDKVRKNFEVNVFSNISFIKEYLEYSRKKDRFVKVVVVSSIAGLLPVPFFDSYSATKAALISFVTSLWQQQIIFSLPYSIKLIEPGIYKTGFNEYMLSSSCDNDSIKKSEFLNLEYQFFQFISKKKYNSIVKKMVFAIESNSKKFVYRAPLSQVILLKLYLLFFK